MRPLLLLPSMLLLTPSPTTRTQGTPVRPSVASRRAAPCLHTQPDTVRITGTLRRASAPARTTAAHDTQGRATGYYLRLPAPICTVSGSGRRTTTAGVRRVDLVLDPSDATTLRTYLGQHLVLRGTLLAGRTNPGHAPLLLRVLTPVQVDR
jgi:hypothetical protein